MFKRESKVKDPRKRNHSKVEAKIKLRKWLHNHIQIEKYYNEKYSSEEEKHDIVCQISIDSDDEERKIKCGGYVKFDQRELPCTETYYYISVQNQSQQYNENEERKDSNEMPRKKLKTNHGQMK